MDKRTHEGASPSIRALVVDDSTTLRRLVELTLAPMGVVLDFAETGEQAMTLAKSTRYDIIFLDVVLPGIDGYRVCKTIKNERRTMSTPVVMLTSRSSPIDKIKGMMAGANVYLTKPVDRLKLLHAIDECLPKKCFAQGLLRPAAAVPR